MARPRGFEPLTFAPGGHSSGSFQSGVGRVNVRLLKHLGAYLAFQKTSFKTVFYTIKADSGHRRVWLLLSENYQIDLCLMSMFSRLLTHSTLRNALNFVWFRLSVIGHIIRS